MHSKNKKGLRIIMGVLDVWKLGKIWGRKRGKVKDIEDVI